MTLPLIDELEAAIAAAEQATADRAALIAAALREGLPLDGPAFVAADAAVAATGARLTAVLRAMAGLLHEERRDAA